MNDKENKYEYYVTKQLQVHDERLNNHSGRLDKVEQENVRLGTKIENLIDKMDSLTTTMRWFMGLLIGAYVSFFFYVIQHKLF